MQGEEGGDGGKVCKEGRVAAELAQDGHVDLASMLAVNSQTECSLMFLSECRDQST